MIGRRLYLRLTGDYACARLVEAVTDYLDGRMPPRERARFERHLDRCLGCERYLAQIRATVALTGRLAVDDVDALGLEARATLLNTFRRARSEHGTAPE